MSRKYKPQHMKQKEVTPMFNHKGAPKVALTAALTVAVAAPSVLAPATAFAQVESARRDAMQQVADARGRWSEATQKLIHAAEEAEKNNKVMTAEEADAELAKVESMRNDAAANDAAAQEAYANAQAEQAAADRAYAEAARAKLEEQKKQAEALVANLQAAQADAAKTAEAVDAAQAELTDLTNEHAKATVAAQDAAKASAEADVALEKAQADLDKFLADSNIDEADAEYQAAKKAYDEAVIAKQEADAAHEAAKKVVETKRADVDAKKAELEAAQAELPVLEAAVATAETDLRNAKDGYAETVEQIAADSLKAPRAELDRAQAEYDAVKDSGVEQAIAEAKAKRDAAQAAYDEAVATAGAKAQAEADAAIAAKQEALDTATAKLDETRARVEALPAEITALEEQLAAEDAKLAEAQQVADAATEACEQANGKVDAAQQAYDEAVKGHETWAAEHEKLVKDAEDARVAADEAKAAFDAATKTVAELEAQKSEKQKKIDELRQQMADQTQGAIKNASDFFKFIKSQGAVDDGGITPDYVDKVSPGGAANDVVTGAYKDMIIDKDHNNMLSSYTKLDDPNDASAVGNMLKALDIIEECNALRVAQGLPELYVSDYAMAVAIVNTNWSAANLDKTGKLEHVANHGGNRGWAENVNAGYSSAEHAFEGWYWQERANYEKKPVYDKSTGKTYYPEEPDGQGKGQTGHYLNVVDGSYTVTGAAWNATGFNGRPVMGQEFRDQNGFTQWLSGHSSNIPINENIYTLDAYRARLLNAMSGAGNAQLQAQIDQLSADIKVIDGQIAAVDLAGKKAASETAAAEQTKADKAVTDHAKAEPGLADATAKLDAAKAEAKRAEEAKATAEANLSKVTGEVTAKKDQINAQLAAKRKELEDAQNSLPALETAKEKAQAEYDDVRGQYADITDASAKLNAAEANLARAEGALADKNAEVAGIQAAIVTLEGELADAEADATAKGEAANAASTTVADKKQLMDDAKAESDRLNGERDQLQAKVDAAQTVATEKAAAKADADKHVADLEKQLEDGRADLEGLKRDAAHAAELETAWGKFLHAYDPTEQVVNGSIGVDAMPSTDASVREEIHAAVEAAHGKYEKAKIAESDAKMALDTAEAKLEVTRANAEATEGQLVVAEAEYAQAKAAHAKVIAFLASLHEEDAPGQEGKPQKPIAQQVVAKPNASDATMPQTGDNAVAAVAFSAAAGLSMVGVAEILRRRSQQS